MLQRLLARGQKFAPLQKTPVRGDARKKLYVTLLTVSGLLLIVMGAVWQSLPAKSPTASTGTSSSNLSLPAPLLPSGSGVPAALNMGMPGAPTSITSLQAPLTALHMRHFTLVAQSAVLSLGSGIHMAAWTFNGVAPGPTLRVQQGDLVVVDVVNHLSFSITIHWHGIEVPNAADGVAGVTQDAIKPGQSYTYRFVANEPGTYWYHSHQLSYAETVGGLFGNFIVDPTTTTIHADVDQTVDLHEWNGANDQPLLTINNTAGTLNAAAQPGQWVRLRIVNTSNTPSGAPQLVTLVGAPFQVVALDGHDLNGPQWLTQTPLPIGSAQRYDLLFQMPPHGSVSLVTASDNDQHHYQRTPALVLGQGSISSTLPAVKQPFDLTTYGLPAHTAITLQSHFDASYGIILNNQMGTSLGRSGMTYTMNGKVFPDTGMLMVKEGQVVKIHFDNQSDLYHSMHIHGHIFTVLAHNGKPLTGSPVRLDTVLVPPHESYDIAFVANNPGIWMIHCHNFLHANWGMDMMLMYNVSTPYTVGSLSGNFPD